MAVGSAVKKPPNELRPPLLTEPVNEDPPAELKPEDKVWTSLSKYYYYNNDSNND